MRAMHFELGHIEQKLGLCGINAILTLACAMRIVECQVFA